MEKKPGLLKRLFAKLWRFKYIKSTVYSLIVLLLLFGIGYTLILFGGKLVIDEKDLILDATTIIQTKDGDTIKELYEENRKPISIEEIPSHVPNAFIAIEDRRFREHGGVDYRSILRAVVHDIAAGSKVQGASTITQQVVKNLSLSQDKTWMRKTKEMMAAIYLDKHYTKDEILELYLNAVYFGDGAYGIEQAAHVYFGKTAQKLTVGEAATLAGMVKSPTGYSPINHPDKAKSRRNTVLSAMQQAGYLSAEQEVKLTREALGIVKDERKTHPWTDSYADYVMKEAASEYGLSIEELKRGGYRITAGMNPEAQKAAYEAFKQDSYFPGSAPGVEGSFVLMDQRNGELAALIGARDYKLGDLNRVGISRQPGSTMKPLAVYGPALMKKKYKPYSLLVDQLRTYNGYTASNYDDKYDNAVTMYEALIQSKNAPAVWLLNEIGVPYSKKYLSKMGMDIEEKGLGIALGGLVDGVTPIQIAGAYRTFIHEGEYIKPHAIKEIRDAKGEPVERKGKIVRNKVFSKQVSWNMVEMLRTTVLEGTARSGDYDKALAGKTGSTQHPFAKGKTKDAWFAGFTPQYSMALWMGYDASDAEHYLTAGSEYPTMLAKEILTEMDKATPLTEKFAKPAKVKSVPSPIHLPEISEATAKLEFGGMTLVKAKISWQSDSNDDRVVYRVYEAKDGLDKRVGEIEGEKELTISNVDLFKSHFYYVVPYDPLSKLEGKRSTLAELGF